MSTPVYWIEEYPKKDPHHLTSHRTCVVDGTAWRVDENGDTFCAGKLDKLDKEKPDKS